MTVTAGINRIQNMAARWEDEFIRVAGRIKTLAGTSEEAFLAIGEKLQEFYMLSGEISQKSASAADFISGGKFTDTIESLHCASLEIRNASERFAAESDNNARNLNNIKKHLEDVFSPLKNFERVVRNLMAFGISTRIESARLGHSESDFDSLAKDIKDLAIHIDQQTSMIEEHIDSLSDLITVSFDRATELSALQKGQLENVFENTCESLESLSELNQKSSISARNISKASNDITSSIEEIIMSMQFQDISRQQMEHVVEALDSVTAEMKNGIGVNIEDDPETKKIVRLVGDVCNLQSAQLNHSKDTISSAILNIKENLAVIAASISEMGSEAGKLAGETDEEGSSILLDIESEIKESKESADSLENSSKIGDEISQVMIETANAVGRISAFVKDIEMTGSEIELIALNARIKAAHTGGRGAAMGILAESIQKLSLYARSQTIAVSGILNSISKTAAEFGKSIHEQVTGLKEEAGVMAKDLKSSLNSLHSINSDVLSVVTDLDRKGVDFSASMNKAINEITVHDDVALVINDLICGLKRIMADSREIAPEALMTDEEILEMMENRYTMETERKIHEYSLTGLQDMKSGNCKSCDSDSESLGDNIELF